MIPQEVIVWGVYLGLAFGAGLGIVAFLVVLIHGEKSFGSWVLPALVPLIALGISASSVLSGRDLKYASFGAVFDAGGGSPFMTTWGLRAITIAMLGLCIARIIAPLLRGQAAADLGRGKILFYAFLAFFLFNNVVNSFFGEVPSFEHKALYPVLLFAAIYAARGENLVLTLEWAKYAVLFMLTLGLVLAGVKPSLAIQEGYSGVIPGINFRFWGVGSHANTIGPLALLALLLEYMAPFKRKIFRGLSFSIAFVVFILAQSKTVWLASLIFIPILLGVHLRASRSLPVVISASLIAVGLMLLAFILFYTDIGPVFSAPVSEGNTGDISTLSGRASIWQIAINEWLKNPLFGYGPEIWGLEFRIKYGALNLTSAHNQLLQSLSSAGLFGAASWVLYFLALGVAAIRAAPQTKGGSLALYLVIAFRCITETPMSLGTLFNGDMLMHVVLFTVCLLPVANLKPRTASVSWPKQMQAA